MFFASAIHSTKQPKGISLKHIHTYKYTHIFVTHEFISHPHHSKTIHYVFVNIFTTLWSFAVFSFLFYFNIAPRSSYRSEVVKIIAATKSDNDEKLKGMRNDNENKNVSTTQKKESVLQSSAMDGVASS